MNLFDSIVMGMRVEFKLQENSARLINDLRHTPGNPVWQRNYYEHIIRNEKLYDEISEYILNNPAQWEQDKLFILGAL